MENDKTFVKKGRLTLISLGGFVLRFQRKGFDCQGIELKQLLHRPAGFVVKEFETELHGRSKASDCLVKPITGRI